MLTLKLKLKIKQRAFDNSVVNKAESELVRMWYSASRQNLVANGQAKEVRIITLLLRAVLIFHKGPRLSFDLIERLARPTI